MWGLSYLDVGAGEGLGFETQEGPAGSVAAVRCRRVCKVMASVKTAQGADTGKRLLCGSVPAAPDSEHGWNERQQHGRGEGVSPAAWNEAVSHARPPLWL